MLKRLESEPAVATMPQKACTTVPATAGMTADDDFICIRQMEPTGSVSDSF
jgi:hypothetical protein